MRSLVISDLDKTLIRINTSYRFGKHLNKKGLLSSYKTFLLITYYLRHLLGIDSAHTIHQKSFELFFKGKSFQLYNDIAHRFSQEVCNSSTNQQVARFLQEKKDEGARLCLLSTGPELLVKHFGALFEFDSAVGTCYTCDQKGMFLNVGQVIDGTAKASITRDWMREEDYDRIYALTDSYHDLPLLEQATDPIVVNPDKHLRQIAMRRGYKIL